MALPLAFVALQVVALARFGGEVDWGSPESVGFVAALAAVGGAGRGRIAVAAAA